MPLFLKGYPLILILYRMWRRLPPSQRRRMLQAARRHGPRMARTAYRQARARRRAVADRLDVNATDTAAAKRPRFRSFGLPRDRNPR